MSSIPSRSLVAALFVPEEGNYFQCRLCFLRRKQAQGTGYTNLVEHLVRYHASTYEDEFRSIQRRKGSLDSFVKGDDFSRNVYHWLDWIVMENRELSMCEKTKTRKYTHLKPLCVNTLKKHMFELESVVQASIKTRLQGKKLGFAVDAWTEDGTHFVAIIAITPSDKFLLCFSTLSNESDMSADATIDLFDYVLDTYGIDAATQLCFYVCDHASVNVAIARKTSVPMIGCASHRMNLAVHALMEEHTDLLDKVHRLMTKLNTIKNRHHLREADALMPVFRNATRRSSTFAMIDRYFRIYKKLDRVDDDLADFISTPRENVRLKALHEDLKNLESVSKKLQSATVSLLDVRVLFDHVMKHYPGTEAQLATTASLVKFLEFENGIVKVLASKERSLTRAERTAVSKLLKSGTSPSEEVRQETPIPKKRSFAEAALAEENETAPQNQVDLRWIPPTSNDVERLFSRAGVVYSRIRRSLNPMALETVMFLQYNRSLWDASCVAQAVENNRKKRRAETR
ncbi:unnamed protein product [Phytophthora lilii]|uniref:Unnamed protein product n=1 Tax=Phytophthora lilii TaxID=2077276 RepID=A0A9W6TEM5_9STRA|nr:unnamed protein product [Phytophthora lilii]